MKSPKRTPNFKKSRRWLQKSSPTILTFIGAAGVIATAVLAVRATPKALLLIKEDSKKNHGGDSNAFTKKEAVLSCWKCYIPSAITGTATLFCIFGANILNKRQQASLMSAYAFVDQSYRKYKSKLKELYGEEAHNAIIDSIAKEKCSDVHITCPGLISNSTLDFECGMEPEITRVFYDSYSGRYFETSISKVIQAEYHLNRNFMFNGVISLNDFYDFLGLEKTDIGNEVGWSCCNGDIYWIDFNHHKITLDDGLEIFIIDMVFEPTAEWLNDI